MSEAYHIPVMVDESLDGLNIKPDGIYVDATFGGGGHSKEILKRLNGGKLFAFDQDIDAGENAINDNQFVFFHQNYRYIKNFLRYYKIESVDGIIADLGISSHQIDCPERGFSFRYQSGLDMRMNRDYKNTAASILQNYSKQQLNFIFKEYGEIHNTRQLVNLIEEYRTSNRVGPINEFIEAISGCVPKQNPSKYLAKVFQALRIEVNNEIEVLKLFLQQTIENVKKNGRLVVLSYHSLEDRLVKNFIRSGKFTGEPEKDIYGNLIVPFRAVHKKVIVPCDAEMKKNPRARSAKLRIAQKL